MDIEQEITNNIIKSGNNQLDNILLDCLKAWGVDTNNHDEIKRRCEIHLYDGDKYRRVLIDGYLVVQFSDWEINNNFNMLEDKIKMDMTMECSDIMTPKDYGFDKYEEWRQK
tara:strand:+ start:311 stop:646 length:336 start_codon:yes stop_codon:yes gene_type:complete